MKIGHKLKRLRVINSLTQGELASRTDLSKGFISQIENDAASPSIATLEDILEVLGTSPNEFFSDIDSFEKVVYSKSDRVLTPDSNKKFQIELLIPGFGKRKMDPVLVSIKPHEESFKDPVHEGEELGFLLKGKIELHLEDKTYTLTEGDCFYFAADKKHSITNRGKQTAQILWVVTPPIF
jgi:transcriptional regulator with XRE-family HTH domain